MSDGDDSGHAAEIAHASLRGAIAAAAMTGMRVFTVDVGLVDQTPPQAIVKQRAKGLLRRVPRGKRRAAIELAHWTYGAVGGAAYAVLPEEIRRQPWSGPAYGRNPTPWTVPSTRARPRAVTARSPAAGRGSRRGRGRRAGGRRRARHARPAAASWPA